MTIQLLLLVLLQCIVSIHTLLLFTPSDVSRYLHPINSTMPCDKAYSVQPFPFLNLRKPQYQPLATAPQYPKSHKPKLSRSYEDYFLDKDNLPFMLL